MEKYQPEGKEFRFGSRQIRLTSYSLARLKFRTDVLVSSDDNRLSHGGGVSAALWKSAGAGLARYVEAQSPKLGLANIYSTPAFRLDAKRLFHIVTIDFDRQSAITTADLTPLFRRVLFDAGTYGTRVGLPLVATGAAEIGPEEAVRELGAALKAWLDTPSRVNSVTVAAPDHFKLVATTFEEILAHHVPVEELMASTAERVLEPGFIRHPTPWEAAVDASSPVAPGLLAQLFDRLMRACAERLLEEIEVRSRRGEISGDNLKEANLQFLKSSATNQKQNLSVERIGEDSLLVAVEKFIAAARVLGLEQPPSLPPALVEAAVSRNVAIHGVDIPIRFDSYDQFLAAIRSLVEFVGSSNIGNRRGQPETLVSTQIASFPRSREPASQIAPDELAVPLTRTLPRHRQMKVVRARSAATESQGRISTRPLYSNSPIRKFHQFMEEHLHPKRRQELDKELEAIGHLGAPEVRRLEHWLAVRDPVAALANEFTIYQLKQFFQQKAQPAGDDIPREKLAKEILRSMGFVIPLDPDGLETAHRRIEEAFNTALTGGPLECQGAVTAALQQFEKVCHMLIHFVCRVAFKRDAEAFFRARGTLLEKQTLRKSTLGTLIRMLTELQTELKRSSEESVIQFEKDFSTRSVFPKLNERLVADRNDIVHYGPGDTSEGELIRKSQTILNEMKTFVMSLKNTKPRVFPDVIVVDRINVDRWGRRFVFVRTSRGIEEMLFTDEPVEPGMTYLMHPLNNPVRVDPILVPAGDLSEA